jgi:hypothetical protein
MDKIKYRELDWSYVLQAGNIYLYDCCEWYGSPLMK